MASPGIERLRGGSWQWNISTNEMHASLECYELHGRADIFGKRTTYEDWAECLHPEDRARAEKAVTDTLEMRSPEYKNEYRIVLPSGGVRWVDVLGKVDYAADGTPSRISGITLDITERKRTEKALRKAEEFQRQKSEELETILAAMPAAVIIAKDADCVEMAGNLAAYDLLRLAPHQDLSKSAPQERAPKNYEVFSNGCQLSADEMPIQRAVAGKKAILADELEIRFAEGDSKFALSNALPLFDDTGEVRGTVGAFADITSLKRTEAALRESEDRLKFALEAAGAGTWEVELETGELAASDKALSFLGIAPGIPVSHEIALARVHPEDRSRTRREAPSYPRNRGALSARMANAACGRFDPVAGNARRAASRFRKAGCCRSGSRHHRAETRRRGAARKRGALEICARSGKGRNMGGGVRNR